jgi:hypothetical protein
MKKLTGTSLVGGSVNNERVDLIFKIKKDS